MSTPGHSRFDDLLSRYLDSRLHEREEAELLETLADPRQAERFLEMTVLHAELAGLAASPMPDAAMVDLVLRDLRGESDPIESHLTPLVSFEWPAGLEEESPPETGRRRVLLFLAAAACLCLLAGLLLHGRPGRSEIGAEKGVAAPKADYRPRITSLHGDVYYQSATGEILLRGKEALAGVGSLRTAEPKSTASIVLADGTRVVLAEDSVLGLQITETKSRLYLAKGRLYAEVFPLPAGHELLFATANAEATSDRASLTLIWQKQTTLAVVNEGSATVKRLADGWTADVPAGSYAHVENEGRFFAWPIGRAPKALREESRPPN